MLLTLTLERQEKVKTDLSHEDPVLLFTKTKG